ncbi:MAG: peptidyl-prolyl cis-trans isomerase [Candidatus Abyssobacteria bacterium SURF_5]|uniref:peptidylprolyl isomerase n=1 Tax=Abyssobacteria bacterium (strain SURF_5) TaxID=2093360 RepID=A0A3A4P624_ABYX5|nr:MAG: peptidyl-prolyl cis-trans isomerase [Candidatus Abyssubacteria bacterium SURF_5]
MKGMNMRRHICFLLFFVLAPLTGCGLLVDQGRQVMAEVGGKPIRRDDLMARIRMLPFEERAKTNDPDQAVRLDARRSLLENIIIEELLILEAESRGNQVSDEEVFAVLEAREQEEQEAELEEGMGGTSAHEHKGEDGHSKQEINEVRRQLMVQKMIGEELNETTRKRYYEAHPDEFSISPPQFVYELLVVDARNDRFLKDTAQKAEQEGVALSAAVASVPDAPPINFCGEIPPTPFMRLTPAIREKVKGLSIDQVSEPFQINPADPNLHAVARLARRIDAIPYEQVKQAINQKLYENFLRELRDKHKVVYYQDRLDYRLEG